ncbi:MAG: ankyrin repeat domain-containing protein [Nonlabens sp.]
MKNILSLIALMIVCTTAGAQQLSKEMTIALKNNDPAALSQLVDDSNKDECLVVGKRKSTLLQLAVQMNSTKTGKYLLETAEVDVNKTCGDLTPLMYAAKFGHVEMVKLLVDNGADSSIVVDGKTAASIVSKYKKDEILALLK